MLNKIPKVDIKFKEFGNSGSFVLESATINGKRSRRMPFGDIRCGFRAIYFHKDYVIKTEDMMLGVREDNFHHLQTCQEIEMYSKISKSDLKYFPKLIRKNKKVPYIIVERISIDYNVATCKRFEPFITKLAKKYGIYDVSTRGSRTHNWGVNKKTGLPVIFDMGCTVVNKGRPNK